jgi:hypothetical protein
MATRGRTGIFPHRIDQTTDANAFVDYEHREVHVGDAFYYTVVDTLDEDAVLDRFIRVPNTTRWPHFEFLVEATSLITVQLYEGAAGAAAAETVRNRNRNFADGLNTTTVRLATDPAGGTLIWQWKSGIAAAIPARGQTPLLVRDDEELVLKQATDYLFRVTSGSDANAVAVYFTWYEHTNIEN